jgi:hypothetical protein
MLVFSLYILSLCPILSLLQLISTRGAPCTRIVTLVIIKVCFLVIRPLSNNETDIKIIDNDNTFQTCRSLILSLGLHNSLCSPDSPHYWRSRVKSETRIGIASAICGVVFGIGMLSENLL